MDILLNNFLELKLFNWQNLKMRLVYYWNDYDTAEDPLHKLIDMLGLYHHLSLCVIVL